MTYFWTTCMLSFLPSVLPKSFSSFLCPFWDTNMRNSLLIPLFHCRIEQIFYASTYHTHTIITVHEQFLGPVALWAILCLSFPLLCVVGSLTALGPISQAPIHVSFIPDGFDQFSNGTQWLKIQKGELRKSTHFPFLLSLRLLFL